VERTAGDGRIQRAGNRGRSIDRGQGIADLAGELYQRGCTGTVGIDRRARWVRTALAANQLARQGRPGGAKGRDHQSVALPRAADGLRRVEAERRPGGAGVGDGQYVHAILHVRNDDVHADAGCHPVFERNRRGHLGDVEPRRERPQGERRRRVAGQGGQRRCQASDEWKDRRSKAVEREVGT
jgi:hypothetical protein